MAGLKEIESRLRSVQNTKKITYAMKLVAAAKLRKAQEAVQRSRAYTDALGGLLAQLSGSLSDSEGKYPLMNARAEVKNIHLVVIGGARGLCGGYNANLHRKVESAIKELSAEKPGATISTTILGRKPAEYYRRVNRQYLESFENLLEDATKWPIDDICGSIQNRFLSGEFDEVYVIFMNFKSALSQIPTLAKVLPLDPEALKVSEDVEQGTGVALFEPSADELFNALLPRIFRSKIRQASLDAKASETAARMTAMDAATKNAGELTKTLTRQKNKLRQGKITSQLLDIVGGAEAVS